MKHLTICLFIILTVLSLTGCAKKEIPAETMSPLTPAATVAAQETEAPKLTNAQLAEEAAMNFANAYFAGKKSIMEQFLTDPYEWSLDSYPDDGDAVQINGLNGLQDMSETTAKCVASLEFRETAESDSFTYLTMEMVKQQGIWKIQFYGLEK